MKKIGITGGIGAGKSKILAYINSKYNCFVLMADEVAHLVEQPGERCYEELVSLLGPGILCPDGQIDKKKMAERIFADQKLLGQVNELIHPAVKEYILNCIKEKEAEAGIRWFFVEAALLIEDGYAQLLDELWYIRAEEQVRRERLKKTRGYSDEKISSILEKQLPEDEFGRHCKIIIENSTSIEETYSQIDRILEESKQ